MLRFRGTRGAEPPEEAPGVRMPEPVPGPFGGVDPERRAPLARSAGPAPPAVPETLTPAERLAFVPYDLFAVLFDEIAPIAGRTRRPPGRSPAGPGPAAGAPPRTRRRRATSRPRTWCSTRTWWRGPRAG
ncbi:hypothetical protein ACFRDV_31125 [Streptomyces fagopyri]|uniref:hypothetical protein n=1 Tax=Streptomyces fagopyri TaxID=2662397 RepID=UPI003675DBE4